MKAVIDFQNKIKINENIRVIVGDYTVSFFENEIFIFFKEKSIRASYEDLYRIPDFSRKSLKITFNKQLCKKLLFEVDKINCVGQVISFNNELQSGTIVYKLKKHYGILLLIEENDSSNKLTPIWLPYEGNGGILCEHPQSKNIDPDYFKALSEYNELKEKFDFDENQFQTLGSPILCSKQEVNFQNERHLQCKWCEQRCKWCDQIGCYQGCLT